MTFTELVTTVSSRINLTSPEAVARIGIEINDRYKRLTSSLGLNVTRQTTVGPIASTLGVTTVVLTGIEKIINVVDRSTTPYRILKEISIQELRANQPSANTFPSYYAIVDVAATSVTIEMDCVPQAAFDLYADGYVVLSTLSGAQVPAFAESFHYILAQGALADEYRKLMNVKLAQDAELMYERGVSDLRFFIIKSSSIDVFQGKTRNGYTSVGGTPGAGGGGSSVNGASSWTQTGLITFSRGVSAPFVVNVGAAKVANLDADFLDGLDSTAFTLASAFAAHHTQHESGGSDAIKLDDLSAPDDNTDLNASTTKHGLLRKLDNVATNFLNGQGAWTTASSTDATLSFTDITTNNVSNTKHGFVPKATDDTGNFLRADGAWGVAYALVCQGRLTLTTAVPVTTADVTGATNVFFTPYGGNRVALFGGTYWKLYTFTERTLALGTITNDLPYDVFLFDNAGTLTLELLAWTNKTTRATALVLQDGVLSKSGALTRRYLGTFHTTATTTTEDSEAKRLLWNYYNRVPRSMRRQEATGNWTYSIKTWRQANAAVANQFAFVIGVAETPVQAWLTVEVTNSGTAATVAVSLGLDSTSAPTTGALHSGTSITSAGVIQSVNALYTATPAVGYHFLAWLEISAASGTTTFRSNNDQTFTEQSGMIGTIQG